MMTEEYTSFLIFEKKCAKSFQFSFDFNLKSSKADGWRNT